MVQDRIFAGKREGIRFFINHFCKGFAKIFIL